MDVRAVITAALKELGVLAATETPSADQLDDGLQSLNNLVDDWKTERLLIYTVTRTTGAMTASQQDYTVGTGGQINIEWPTNESMKTIQFIDTSANPGLELYLGRETDDSWAAIPIKTLTSNLPTTAYYNPSFPLGTISFYPVPTSTTLRWVVYVATAVDEFTSVSQTVSLPPGWRRMIVTNLAVEMASSYEREITESLAKRAFNSKLTVKRSNYRPQDMSFDPGAIMQKGAGRVYNIYSDT